MLLYTICELVTIQFGLMVFESFHDFITTELGWPRHLAWHRGSFRIDIDALMFKFLSNSVSSKYLIWGSHSSPSWMIDPTECVYVGLHDIFVHTSARALQQPPAVSTPRKNETRVGGPSEETLKTIGGFD